MHLKNVLEILTFGGGYQCAIVYALKLQGPIEIDGLVINLSFRR
jgi:hypothetical protein